MVSPVALQNDKHANLKITPSGDYSRYKEQHLVPIITQDFFTLCAEFPVVFVKDTSGENFVPVVIMGLREGQNLYCQTDEWQAPVVPVRFNSAPFSITKVDPEGEQLAVLIDEDSPMLSEIQGTPLFNDDGTKSEFLEKKIEFLVNIAQQTVQTESVCKFLKEKDLFATQQLQLQHREDAQRYNIDGVYSIDEQKLNELSDEDYLDMRKQGIIPMIYAHLSSLQQLRRISEKQYHADKLTDASA
ncbi:MAG: SapC family protein [Pseudohongiella sp.]|nr:MAG: SapC family protein [Pseudohongiella sp.]